MSATMQRMEDRGVVKIDGAKMRRLRQERYLSIRDLAKLAGVANYTVASAEIGKRPGGVRLRTIRKLAKALNVHPRELEAREDDEL